jgi:hypothetical protein
MTTSTRYAERDLEALRGAKILGVRAGTEHKFTGVWVVVVKRSVFVRSWSDQPTGWYRAFREEPRGMIQVGEREIAVRARHVRSERTRHAVSQAFSEKYDTRASEKWVRGFADPRREATTLELAPEHG